jgi:hypothetical protein
MKLNANACHAYEQNIIYLFCKHGMLHLTPKLAHNFVLNKCVQNFRDQIIFSWILMGY